MSAMTDIVITCLCSEEYFPIVISQYTGAQYKEWAKLCQINNRFAMANYFFKLARMVESA